VFEGFLPLKKGRKSRIRWLASEKRTVILYESPHRVQRTLQEIYQVWGNRKCVMGREITKKFEEFFYGDMSELLIHFKAKPPKGEIVLIISGSEDRH
jgi:16S rRNA (cytidine1402-2'-O)-methyltransferase